MSKSHRTGAPRNHRKHSSIKESEPRCIYCARTRETGKLTLEHMPPVSMFRNRQRLKGMEFATCAACNNGTKGADMVAAFMARLGQDSTENDWQTTENRKQMRGLAQCAPGMLEEFFNDSKTETVWAETASGVLTPKIKAQAGGPILRAHMNAFSAKLAMALYREHIGSALPLDGRIETIWFLNAGLSEESATKMLTVLPIGETLRQGAQHVTGQFAYRYNTDEKEVVAALVGFHSNLHILTLATSNPVYAGQANPPHLHRCRPGQLLEMIAAVKPQRFILPGLPGGKSLL